MTLVEGVLSIPPGHPQTINLADASAPVRPEAYWSIAEGRGGESSGVSSFRVFEFQNSGDAQRGRHRRWGGERGEGFEFRVPSSEFQNSG